MAEPKEPKKTGKKKAKKARAEPVYVPVAYPLWFGAASFAWAVVGWLVAAFAPRLAFVPMGGVLHLAFPTVTVALLGVNLYLAVRNLLRGAHVLRLALITGVEVALFTTLFFQFYAHFGAELYDAPGETTPWQWLQFSAAHAFRAGDVFDAVEAYGWGIQSIKHTSPLVGVFVVAYHVVVDVFFLGLVWAAVGRFREAVLADDEFRGMLVRLALAAFAVWFVAWVVVAFFVRPWRFADVPLWFAENALRVVDFADVMESFGIRLHTLPREGVVGTLTLFCRLWIALGLAVLLTRKRKPPARRVLTPPGVAAKPYWGLRVGALAGMAVALFITGLVGWLIAGHPADSLAAAVKEGPDGRAEDALRTLRRMGPSAGAAVPELVAARPGASPAVRDGITRTLGYLGTSAAAPLRAIALTDPPESAGLAVDSLAAVGGPAAPDLVAVWEGTAEPVKDRADAALRQIGGAGVGPLTDGFTPENAHGHYVWLQKLDPNWRLRGTTNPTAVACQGLPRLVERATNPGNAPDAAAAMGEMRACGTAARVILDTALDNLNHKEQVLQSASAEVVVAAGPKETPRLLEMAKDAKGDAIPPGVVTALKNPSMWTAAVLADPGTLPALLAIAPRSQGFPIALPRLAHYGAAAAPAAPVLIPRVADGDADTRATVRGTLDKVHPQWKADPVFTQALPKLLYEAAKLPPEEADDLFAAFQPITAEQAKLVGPVIQKQLRELNKMYTGRGAWTKESPAQYATSLDDVFGPVERLGPRAKELVPTFNGMIRSNAKELNDPKPRIVSARLVKTIERVGGSEAGSPGTLEALGYGDEGFAFIRKQGKAALPTIAELIDSAVPERKLFGVRAAEALGAEAAEAVPRLVAALRDANRDVAPRFNEPVWLLGRLAQALTRIEPDWWARPAAAAALGEVIQPPPGAGTREQTALRRRAIELVAGGGPPAAAAAPKIAAAVVREGVIDPELKGLFDKLAPDWRADADVKAAAPKMAERIASERGFQAERALIDLGPAGLDGITTTLSGLSKTALADRFGREGGFLRDKSLLVLPEFGPAAKAATPTLLALVAKPELHPEAAPKVLAALDKAHPGWAADPAYKDDARAAGEALVKRAAQHPTFVGLAGRCGVEVGGELARQFAAARSDPEAVQVLGQIAAAGPAAKQALPALTKVAADKNGRNRGEVIDAVSKVAAGDAALVPTLAPLLLDPDAKVRAATAPALDRLDPKWRTKPAAKAVVATAKGQLSGTDDAKRGAAADALGHAAAGDATLVPTLCPFLLNTEPAVRTTTAAALEKVDPAWRTKPAAKTTTTAALKQLSDAGARKRFDAVGALDLLRPAEAVAPLEQLVARETDANTRQYAEQVLGRLRKKE